MEALLAKLPDEILSEIYFNSMIILYRKQFGTLLDELTIKNVTQTNMHGNIFLTITGAIQELVDIEYSYEAIERIPSLESII
jgi:hypothetical protein